MRRLLAACLFVSLARGDDDCTTAQHQYPECNTDCSYEKRVSDHGCGIAWSWHCSVCCFYDCMTYSQDPGVEGYTCGNTDGTEDFDWCESKDQYCRQSKCPYFPPPPPHFDPSGGGGGGGGGSGGGGDGLSTAAVVGIASGSTAAAALLLACILRTTKTGASNDVRLGLQGADDQASGGASVLPADDTAVRPYVAEAAPAAAADSI
jgi:hypothetical protein